MKEMVRYGLILAFICVLASSLLALVNTATKDRIIMQARAEEESSLKEVLPQAADFKPVTSQEEVLYYKGVDTSGKLVGVVFKASGKGYAGNVDTMVGMTPDGVIAAIKVIAHSETPGLGSRIAEKEFSSRFSGKPVAEISGIQAITGATISSRAVMASVESKARQIKGLLGNE